MKYVIALLVLVVSSPPSPAQDSPDRIQYMLTSKPKWTLIKKRSALGGDYMVPSGTKMTLGFSTDRTGFSEDVDDAGRILKSVPFRWQLSIGYDKEPVLLIEKADKQPPGRNLDNFIFGPAVSGSSLKVNVRTVMMKGSDVQLRFTPIATTKNDGTATHYLFN